MKRICMIIVALMGLGAAVAQPTDSVPTDVESQMDSAENTTINGMVETEPATEVVKAAPAQEDEGMSGWLMAGAGLLVGIAGIVMAIVTWTGTKKRLAAKDEEIAEFNRKMKEKCDEYDETIRQLEARLCMSEAENERIARSAAAARPKAAAPEKKAPTVATLYLTRADERGYFMAASATIEPGNSLFALTTADGARGTYRVIDDAGVHQLALMMPTENLTRACVGPNIQVSGGMSRIVTDREGTAALEGGKWRVVTPAQIHYEA